MHDESTAFITARLPGTQINHENDNDFPGCENWPARGLAVAFCAATTFFGVSMAAKLAIGTCETYSYGEVAWRSASWGAGLGCGAETIAETAAQLIHRFCPGACDD